MLFMANKTKTYSGTERLQTVFIWEGNEEHGNIAMSGKILNVPIKKVSSLLTRKITDIAPAAGTSA